ncbi:immunoglobulin-like domain-containing protein [Terribacillus saccharophilus]|uniref:immunoglobulin-like domain-containing protein n=1 Tax=Terribacillus saccharophilus TaxID=361277 RepID=UPI003981E012
MMRSVIPFCLLFFLVGCGTELEPSEYGNDIKKTDSAVTIEVQTDTRTVPNEIPYIIKNQSDHPLTEGRAFVIEKYDDKQKKWLQIPFKKNSAHQLDAWIIDPGSESGGIVNTDQLNRNLTDGDYRLVKDLSSDGDRIVVYDEFTVENDIIQ